MSVEAVRDWAIIILAVETILVVGIAGLVAWQVYRFVRLLKSKAEEFGVLGNALMDSARHTAQTAGETATTVKGTADFVSDTVVEPVVQVVSAVAGARGFVSALFRLSSSSKAGGRS